MRADENIGDLPGHFVVVDNELKLCTGVEQMFRFTVTVWCIEMVALVTDEKSFATALSLVISALQTIDHLATVVLDFVVFRFRKVKGGPRWFCRACRTGRTGRTGRVGLCIAVAPSSHVALFFDQFDQFTGL